MTLFDVYPLSPIVIERGKGCRVYDNKAVEYMDLYGGHAVISIGHSHPHYVQAIAEQAQRLVFYSNSIINPLQSQLAALLGRVSGYDDYSLFLVNSGAEANENALKLASFYNGRKKIIAFKRGFHGRTSAAVRVTDNPKIIAPINQGIDVVYLPLNDKEAFEQQIVKGDVCAVIIEGIQGIGGIYLPDKEFMQLLQKRCNQTNTILILDEIQSGYGRSGKFFAHQHYDITPDIISMAKGMGNGFPIGGILINPKFTPSHGLLGTTFGGNHLACAAAIAVLEVMEQKRLTDNAALVGGFLLSEISKISGIKQVRGLGLMIGMEFEQPVATIRKQLLMEQKVFTGAASTHIIRLLPPLCLSMAEAEEFILRLKRVVGSV